MNKKQLQELNAAVNNSPIIKHKLDIQYFAEGKGSVFIPTLWSARLIAHLDDKLVYRDFFNTDYEGEISELGDTVKINQIGDITIKDYTGADIEDAEDVDGTQQTLEIDQAKYFNFRVKDVLAAQANVTLLDKAMGRASYALASEVDTNLVEYAITKAGIKMGTVENPVIITVDNAYDKLVDLGVLFDENNVPQGQRLIALPAWYIGMLSKDKRFTSKDLSILENGVVDGATVGSFKLRQTNVIVKDETDASIFRCYAADPMSGTFAHQIAKVEDYRPEKNFADAVKGLDLFGREILVPKACAEFVIKRGA